MNKYKDKNMRGFYQKTFKEKIKILKKKIKKKIKLKS